MTSLGDQLSVHSGRLVGKAFGVLLSAALSIGIWWAIQEMKPKDPMIAVLIALGFTAVTVVLAVSWWRDRSFRITAHEQGIAWTRAGTTAAIHFDEIASVSEFRVNGKPAYFVIGRHLGDEVKVPSNVTDRETLLEHLCARPGHSIPTATAIRR